jgi:hypothetical protein
MNRLPLVTMFYRSSLTAVFLIMGMVPAMAELFEAIETTIRDRKSGVGHVSQVLGLAPVGSPEKSSNWVEVLSAGPSRLFRELGSSEIRVDRKTGIIDLISMGVDARTRCITGKEVLSRFGSSPELSVPKAAQGPQAPVYYVYHYPWGDLKMGMSQPGQQCVVSIIVDFNE